MAKALHIPYEPMDPVDFREWSPTKCVPPTLATPMPEATYTAPPTTPVVPPDAPSTSNASTTISATEFCAMVHLFQTLTTTHNALFRHIADIRAQ